MGNGARLVRSRSLQQIDLRASPPGDRERTRAGFEYLKQGYPILGNVPSYDRTEGVAQHICVVAGRCQRQRPMPSWPLAAPGSCYCRSGLRSTTTGGDRRFVQGGGRPGEDNAPHGMASRSCTTYEMPTPPAGKPGSVLDPMNQLAYLNSGRAFRASLVPPGRTIFLSIILRLIKGTTTYFVPRPRKPPTDRTA